MRRRSLLLLPLLAGATACASATGPTPSEPGTPFTLAPGETALVEPDALLIGFVGVEADSRCPSDVNCITAGDASVEIWLRRPPAPKETRVLHTDAGLGDRVEYDGSEIALVELAPVPVSTAPTSASEYRATLVVR